jgi:hypothetical protein
MGKSRLMGGRYRMEAPFRLSLPRSETWEWLTSRQIIGRFGVECAEQIVQDIGKDADKNKIVDGRVLYLVQTVVKYKS